VGILPGEAAACIVLERPERARGSKAITHALLDSTAQTSEEGGALSRKPRQGKALADAIGRALGALTDGGRGTGLVIADLNGTEARAVDWGCALARRPPGSSYADVPVWVPAASFGEVGAATGPVAACLAARGFARGYAPSPSTLIWLWGDAGRRAALYVRAPGP